MPRKPVRRASSVRPGVRSSFHAVPYRNEGTDGVGLAGMRHSATNPACSALPDAARAPASRRSRRAAATPRCDREFGGLGAIRGPQEDGRALALHFTTVMKALGHFFLTR